MNGSLRSSNKGYPRVVNSLRSTLNSAVFNWIHRTSIVFNDAREDPVLDRLALQLQPTDRMLVITSAGCNVLDYLLCGVEHIDAVDVNPLQNALLELKIAGIRNLDYEQFFSIFGRGRCSDIQAVYRQQLRPSLGTDARKFWDRKIGLFSGESNGGSFYFSGPCGRFARMINFYIDSCVRLRSDVETIFACHDLDSQRSLYENRIREKFWGRGMRWVAGRDLTLAMLGVPAAQRRQIERGYPGGVSAYIQSRIDNVFTKIPLANNYHWRVYLFGSYASECCPEYLKPDNFELLKRGLVDRVSIHTATVSQFLAGSGVPISKFVLLDHLDWLADSNNPELVQEWQAIVDRSAPGARVIWRSGGLETDFVNRVQVRCSGRVTPMRDLLLYERELAEQLHQRDRVQTYGSFFIAQILAA
jgi:S-adenosylmethionine-diacylglycerol 3-amino-3-carboxypropyl transferase